MVRGTGTFTQLTDSRRSPLIRVMAAPLLEAAAAIVLAATIIVGKPAHCTGTPNLKWTVLEMKSRRARLKCLFETKRMFESRCK